MTVDKAIAELKKFPGDYTLVCASDEEGNSFNEIRDFGWGAYDARDREFTGWMYEDEHYNGERAMTLEEADAICAWP